MYSASDLRKVLKIEIDGEPHLVVDFQFSKPGKGQALYKCKLKNVKTGAQFEKTYRSVEKIGKPDLRDKDMSYSYPDGINYVFIDPNTYDQVIVDAEVVGDMKYFLEEDMSCKVLFHNDTPLEITLPNHYVNGDFAFSSPVADMDFSPTGTLVLGERSQIGIDNVTAHQARVLEYECVDGVWVLTSHVFHVGQIAESAAGGVDANESRVWASGDGMHIAAVGGSLIIALARGFCTDSRIPHRTPQQGAEC